jgi:hypothetical protein
LFDWPFRNIYILEIHSGSYLCLFFGQNGADGLAQGTDDLTPQRFNTPVWISQKRPFKTM